MNKIDPDEDEDEEGNPIPGTGKQASSYRARGQQLAQQFNNNQSVPPADHMVNMRGSDPGRSFHQPHQQAYAQQQQQQYHHPPQTKRQSSRTTTPQKASKSNHSDYYSGSMEGMVLDPETGEMIPAGSGYDDDGDVRVLNEKPVVIKLGQLTKSADNSTQVCV